MAKADARHFTGHRLLSFRLARCPRTPAADGAPSSSQAKRHGKQGDHEKASQEHHEWGSLDDVLHKLETNTNSGLTSAEVKQRLEKYGPNELKEKKQSPILHFLSFMWNPLSWAMEIAAILAVILGDYLDFGLILGLLILNSSLGFYEERGAQNAIKALKEQLAPEANVLRDGQWKVIQAAELVPGDIVKINMGDIVSADAYVYDAVNLKVDQSSLTGESLPVSKKIGDEVYSGSSIKQGQLHGIVTETGAHTFFGRAATLVAGVDEPGHFQKVLRAIGAFCISFIAIFVLIELLVEFVGRNKPCNGPHDCKALNNALVLIVGGVPIAMPTVLSVTLAIGASQLSKRKAIVSRLTAVEELAGMDILCSDKTGTLTKNELTLDKPVTFGNYTADQVIMAAALASEVVSQDAIDKAVMAQLRDEMKGEKDRYKIIKHQPFDAYSKRSFSQVSTPDGRVKMVTKGAPQVVLKLCQADAAQVGTYNQSVDEFGKRGFRTLGVAEADGDENWRLMGLLPMFDPPRYDTAETIERTKRQGIRVKMITGDQEAIAKELARRVNMGDKITPLPRRHAGEAVPEEALVEIVEDADGFAQVLPEDKYNIVGALQTLGHIVAMTGDGVNDAPALKKADIGVAVAGATSAARAAADIVLTAPGLSTIVAAIIGARIIFQRMKNYSAYAISVTVRLVLTFFVLTVAFDFFYPTVILVILAVANDGSMLALAKDRVMPSKRPDQWRLGWLFLYAIMVGSWLAASTIVLFVLVKFVEPFPGWFDLRHLSDEELRGLIWIQVSVTGLGAIFSIRTHKWVWDSPPGILLVTAFVLSQILSTVLGVYGLRGYPDSQRGVRGCGWGWALFAWIYSLLWLLPLDLIKLAHRKIEKAFLGSRAEKWIEKKKSERMKKKHAKQHAEMEAKKEEQQEKAQEAQGQQQRKEGEAPVRPAAEPQPRAPAAAAPVVPKQPEQPRSELPVQPPAPGGHSEHA